MSTQPPLTDESVVVAFLTGDEEQRDELALYLAHNDDARELLCMAQEALDALHSPESPLDELPSMAPMNVPVFSDQKPESPSFLQRFSLRGSPDRAPSSLAVKPHRRSLLVVEDNPSTRILLVYMLKADYEVSAAAGVDEALNLVHDHTFDGLVLDINLCEERTGIDLLRAIRALPEHRQVPAIACTAYTSFGDHERLLESGFDLYVAKPFTKEHLHDALRYLFEENDPAPRRTGSGFQA